MQNRKPFCYSSSFWKEHIPRHEGLFSRSCLRGLLYDACFLVKNKGLSLHLADQDRIIKVLKIRGERFLPQWGERGREIVRV